MKSDDQSNHDTSHADASDSYSDTSGTRQWGCKTHRKGRGARNKRH